MLQRARLRARLDAGIDRPVTILSAPAGFGKTTLLAEWLTASARPSAWLSLDGRDGNLATFLSYFVAAVRTVCPNGCANTLALLQQSQIPSLPELIDCVLADLGDLSDVSSLPAGQRFILVLDDLHEVREPAIYQFLAGLLAFPPDTMHLVLSMRPEPVPWIDLLAEGNASRIPAEELRFTSQEMTTFMQQAVALPLDQTALAGVERRTKGWPAGLRLIAVTINATGATKSDAAELATTDQFVMDYMLSEVLEHIPPATLSFLLKTSILDRLSGDLCDAVTGDLPSSASQTLQELAQANLFTESLDLDQTWYRYHHLFQKLLRQQLKQNHSAQEIVRLHANASRWFARHGFADEALDHALQAGDPEAAAQIIEDYRHAAINQEHWGHLASWLQQLPRPVIDEWPGLMMLECWVMHNRFQMATLHSRLDQMEALLARAPLPSPRGVYLQSEIDGLRSRLCFWDSDAAGAEKYGRRALAAAPLGYAFVRANAWTQVAAALQMKGDSEGAHQVVQQGLRENDLYACSFRSLLLLTLCYFQWSNADLAALVETAELAIEAGMQDRLPATLARAYHYLGCARYQQNRLDEAAAAFAEVLKRPRGINALVYAQSAIGLAAAYQASGQPHQAAAAADMITDYALQHNNRAILALEEAFSAQLALHQERRSQAFRWARRAEPADVKSAMPAFFVPALALVEVLLAEASPASCAQASQLLERLQSSVATNNNTRFLIDVLALRALLLDASGDRIAALATLDQAVLLAHRKEVVRVFVDLGPRMAALLALLQNSSAAPDFIARLLQTPQSGGAAAAAPVQNASNQGVDLLTRRELDVLPLLAQRLRSREIGELLAISDRTAKRHTENIYRKLGAHSRRQAVAAAIELGLLSPDRE